MAGIASGTPIVGYRDGRAIGPLEEAGIEWSASRAREDLVRGLVRVLSNHQRWTELHERNLAAQKNYFSWGTNRRTIPDGINRMNSPATRADWLRAHPVQYSTPIFRSTDGAGSET